MSNVQEWQQLANKELSRREKTVDSLVQQTAGRDRHQAAVYRSRSR